ncbi:FxsA family protein [Ornithinimicrobium avium]|uniref:FxsA family protein n=1 Tax=Ornithinimicrobium avium TaxID=2283195 RepID=A0A345NJN2_9MICO|nr:FxsA family protein [Ornithinimicrobium avium]AXH95240.1 FxsA family protein [Ornithinimicrobium avium]
MSMTAGPGARPRRRSWVRWLLVALVLLPLLEIVVLIAVGRSIGLGWTILLLIGMAVVGTWLARRETGRTFGALRRAVDSGRMPTDEATDAMLVGLGAFLLILPGFLSDVVGLVLILPFTRPLARRLLQLVVAQQALRLRVVAGMPTGPRRASAPGRGDVIEGEVVSEEPAPGTWQGPTRLGP